MSMDFDYFMREIVILLRQDNPSGIFIKRHRYLTGLGSVSLLQAIFDRYHLGWMTQPIGSYSPVLVWELYAFYHAILLLTMPKSRGFMRYIKYPQLEQTLVKGVMIDILEAKIHRVLLRPDYVAPTSIAECDYKLRVIQDILIEMLSTRVRELT